ncbi:DMT family transporter [Jannaschia sp. LMIT008]|uniref:DMT family transporter n=1 Tax=Jannaschia maritima TaxID=3032585 RepID=UPI002810E763|nr:DMT family transporter [Jannaschia sp. LMIT008]
MPERSTALSGILMALAAFALFAVHDVAVKMLGGRYHVVQVVFFSVLFTMPLVVLMVMRDETRDTLKPHHPWWTALRTASTTVTGFCIFYAFSVLPLAQTYAIIFSMPLIITVLSIPVLGERVGPWRAGAVAVGLVGVLVVLRPGSVEMGLGHLAALTGAFFSSLAAVIVRRIGREERVAVLMLYPMMANVVVMACLLPLIYVPMPLGDLGLWGLMAVFAFGAMLLSIEAYRRADAVLVAPMQYSQIIWAVLYGWYFFGESVDLWTAIGAAIVIGSGLMIVFREGRGGRSTNTPVLRTRSRAETGTTPRIGPMLSEAERDASVRPR